MRGDCAGALATAEGELRGLGRTLYGGVASACLAAFERRADLWPRADAAYTQTRSQAARLDCETRAVYELLRRLVEAHRVDPTARLVKVPVGRRELVCPRFTRITPDHGPAEGGYTVRLEGENLPRVVGVDFLEGVDAEHHIRAVSPDGRHVVITIPRATFSHTLDDPVTISPDGARVFTDSAVQFRYDLPATTTRPSTTTTTTVPTSTTGPSPPSS